MRGGWEVWGVREGGWGVCRELGLVSGGRREWGLGGAWGVLGVSGS